MKNKRKQKIFIIILIIFMIIIFLQSHKPITESKKTSIKLAEKIVDVFRIENISLGKVNHYIRKSAHFFSYMLMGILLMIIFSFTKINLRKSMIISFAITFLFACSDEFHQLFIEGRGGQFSDVILDSLGAFLGITILGIVKK